MCPPCRCFTPQLVETYAHLVKRNVSFEIIFVSSDRSRDSFDSYIKLMPWLAVPYSLQECRLELAALFGVQGIPTLVITNSDGSVITRDGRGEINDDPKGLKFPWKRSLVNILTDRFASKLQETAAVVLFVDGDESDLKRMEKILTSAAAHFEENPAGDDFFLQFFIACDTEASDTLRDVIGIDEGDTVLTVMNLPEGTWSSCEEGITLTEQSVIDIVNNFYSNKLPMQRVGRR